MPFCVVIICDLYSEGRLGSTGHDYGARLQCREGFYDGFYATVRVGLDLGRDNHGE